MHRVAREQHAPGAVALSDQRLPRGPGPVPDQLEIDRPADARMESARDQRVIGLVLRALQPGVEEVLGLAIDLDDIRSHLAIHHPELPALAVLNARGADIGGDHRAAEISLQLGRRALVADAERAAHEALPAVAADEIGTRERFAPTGIDVLHFDRHAVVALIPAEALPAEACIDVRQAPHVLEEKPFDVHLVAAEDRLGHLVCRCGRAQRAHLLRLRRHRDARELPAVEARVVDDVGREPRGQAEPAQLRRDAEPAVVLHGAGIVGATLRMPSRPRLAFHDHRARAERVEVHRQRHADRAAADDDDRRRAQAGSSTARLSAGMTSCAKRSMLRRVRSAGSVPNCSMASRFPNPNSFS